MTSEKSLDTELDELDLEIAFVLDEFKEDRIKYKQSRKKPQYTNFLNTNYQHNTLEPDMYFSLA